MGIQALPADAEIVSVVSALREDGAVVVNDLAPVDTVDAIAQELRGYFDTDGTYAQCDFNGYTTLRQTAILAKSVRSADLIGHDRVLEVIDQILLPNCINYRIGSTTAIEVLPGEKNQVLHRDDSIYPARMAGVEWQVGVMWALTDFTEENGATRVIPGSHRDWDSYQIDASKAVQKPMKRGSALFYMGSAIHGAGENRSNTPRMGLITTYSLGWLRQEVNQYLTVPMEMVKAYPEKIQRLLGYQNHGPNLGRFPDQPDGGWYLKDEGGQI